MKRVVYSLLFAAAIFAFAPFRNYKARAWSSSDEFRINMQYSYSPSSPASPTPASPPLPTPPPAIPTTWSDVGDWQIFLKTHGESLILGTGYPNNNFDDKTESATKDWQSRMGLTPTGIVNQDTYNHSGLKNVTITTFKLAVKPKDEDDKDLFRNPLGAPDNPNGPGGLPPHNSCTTADGDTTYWTDIVHWQEFLKGWEKTHLKWTQYMHKHYPNGTFDETTQKATIEFQQAAQNLGLITNKQIVLGQVEGDAGGTYQAAVTWTEKFNEAPMKPYKLINNPGQLDDPSTN